MVYPGRVTVCRVGWAFASDGGGAGGDSGRIQLQSSLFSISGPAQDLVLLLRKTPILDLDKNYGCFINLVMAIVDISPPPRSEFERQLLRVQRDLLRMGALVENSCVLAREALCDRNLDSAQSLSYHDKHIDQLYRQIELDCMHLLALQVPVDNEDLRRIGAFLQMVRDLERIGDYAEDIGEVALKLFPYPVPALMGRVQTMVDRCRSMVAMSLLALSDLDARSGLEIKRKDDAVDTDYEELYDLLVHQSSPLGPIEPTVLLVLVIRYLERIADHATNIGKRVAYIVTGERT
jgi:phosphate transport system protein